MSTETTEEKEKIEEKKREYSYVDCTVLQDMLGKAVMKDIQDMKTLMALLALKREVDGAMIESKKAQAAMLDQYGLKPDAKGFISWKDHINADVINKKMLELDAVRVELNSVNFMSKEDFFSMAKAFDLNSIDYLEQILLAKQPVNSI